MWSISIFVSTASLALALLVGCQHGSPRYARSVSGKYEWRVESVQPPTHDPEPPPIEIPIKVPNPDDPLDVAPRPGA